MLSSFLPEGILDYFTVTKVDSVVDSVTVHLEESNLPPKEYIGDKLASKGFYEAVSVKDFPIRGKACFLKVRRRRWLNQTTGKAVARDWQLVAKGTRMTGEFATFLKGIVGQHAGKL